MSSHDTSNTADLNLKILRDEESFPGSGQVIQW